MAELDAKALAVFLALVDRPRDEWPAALSEMCSDRPEVRARVERLLADHVMLGAVSLGDSHSMTGGTNGDAEAPGAVIAGNYKLLELLGEGGFGVVYLAEQTTPVRRKVALKILKAGMDTRQVIARFEAERQALAIMDHPNIARIFDGGVTQTGRPFFAMEYVKGAPITEFCDEHKLTPRRRLELFVHVCQAVQHAHQKGLIHRDLKPTNVLVSRHDTTPVVKVIDFGVAKALGQELTDKTLFTNVAQFVGTPLYMSPEQAGMSDLDVDTRSDIYSLGVLLYELLTGTTPFSKERFKKAAYDEIRRIIREEEPPKPSTRVSESTETLPSVAANRSVEPRKLGVLMRGELDWVVMKALEKDRNRRYESANCFAADVQRYLSGEAVIAAPPSAWYRFRKFGRRHKGKVVAGSLIVAALIAGVAGMAWGYLRAETRRIEAEDAKREMGLAKTRAEEAEAQTLADYRDSTNDAIEQLIGSKPELGPHERTYLEKALKRWQAFADRQGDDERSMVVRAEGHFRVGYVWRNLGRQEEARKEYEAARDLYEKLGAQYPAKPAYQQDLATTHNNLGYQLRDLGERNAARKEYEAARDLQKKLVAQHPAVPAYQQALAMTQNNLGNLLTDFGERNAARKEYEAALNLQKKLVAQHPAVPAYHQELALTHNNLGNLRRDLGERDAARKEYQAARDIKKKLVAQHPAVSAYQQDLAVTHNNLGNLLKELGERDAARKEYGAARDLQKKLVAQHPAVPLYQQDLGLTHNNLGNLLRELGERDAARKEHEAARDIRKKLVAQHPAVSAYQHDLAKTNNSLGILLANLGERDAARKECEAARDLQKKLVAQHPAVLFYQEDLAVTHSNLGVLMNDLGERDAARKEHEAARDIRKKLVAQYPAVPAYQQQLAGTHNNLGNLLANLGERDAARKEYEAARDIKRDLAAHYPAVPEYQIELGGTCCNIGLLIQQRQPAESLTWFDQAIATLEPIHRADTRQVVAKGFLRNSFLGRAHSHDALKEHAEAIKDWDKAVELSPPAEQPTYRAGRAASRIQAGLFAEAVAEVADLSQSSKWSAHQWYDFACVYAVSSGKIAGKKKEYGDRAMDCLRKAVAGGWSNFAHMKQDRDLDLLRDRDEFKKLIAELEAKDAPTPPKHK